MNPGCRPTSLFRASFFDSGSLCLCVCACCRLQRLKAPPFFRRREEGIDWRGGGRRSRRRG
ncbi:hypothetical protein M419DRAFT_139506 [Trichoderma reesei RUT C-30]|uniref:Uncharacterized protein n=1 Tax=Hypocrea jecorina (strain ATCC 56765 / BCRC 32924 / NRRL 11460 / Rut C-30) TaxID=1344414 RepID=A0A024RYB7_HYPJR|nr:hypothetical protein M419DRAFT_139506 [Trichoderma reesei RUT C-30]